MSGRTQKLTLQGRRRNFAFPVLLLLVVLLVGCANTCFVAYWNGTVGDAGGNPPPTCTFSEATGTVQVFANVVRTCESCSQSNRIQGLFVSLRGIELHPAANASEKSSEWQELLPQFENQVRQIDLTKANGIVEPIAGRATIPAGDYDLVRMRFVPNQGDTDNLLGSENACGKVALNCVIMGDGRVLPLAFDGDAPEIRISPDRIAGKSLFISPDGDSKLLIDLIPVWLTVTASFRESERFLPTLMGRAKIDLAVKEVTPPKENLVQ